MAEFFVVIPPGWEEAALNEIREIEPFLLGSDGRPDPAGLGEIKVERSGLTLNADPLLALQLHYFAKLPSRFLLRIGNFRATEFYQLEKGFRSIKLASWIGNAAIDFKIEAQKSKINNEKRILEVASRVFPNPKGDLRRETLMIRNDVDQFTVSLDLSGEHLHKRKIGRELGGPAPIRETLAAMLVRFLVNGSSLSSLQQVTLLDPMAGSGTLLSEASHLYRLQRSRSFAFETQPWIPKILKSETFSTNYRHQPEAVWKQLIAADSFENARSRLAELGTTLKDPLHVIESSSEFKDSKDSRLWVIANPPYGERLKALPTAELRNLLLTTDPERVGLILPEHQAKALIKIWPQGWQIEQLPVSNGGIHCLLLCFISRAT